MRNAILLVGGLLLATRPVGAQPTISTVPQDTAGCGQAERDARAGTDSVATRRGISRIKSCNPPAYGRFLADALLQGRSVTDPAALERLWRSTQWTQDGNVFRASLAIAADHRAAVAGRVYAFRAMARLQSPRFDMPFEAMIQRRTDPRTGGRAACRFSRVFDGGFTILGEPLPEGFKVEIEQLARRIFDDPSEPEDVRAAAWCTLNHY